MKFFINTLQLAMRVLSARKGRAMLTILGMMIGIASYIIIMSVGAGAQSLIVNQITSVGSNLIAVLPGASDEAGPPAQVFGITVTTLTYEDGVAIQHSPAAPYVVAVASYVKSVEEVSWEGNTIDTSLTGTTSDYPIVEGAYIAGGRFISSDEEKNLARVAVLGKTAADNLFGETDPLNRYIRIKRERFQVIGVMQPQGVTGFQNQDDQIFIPLRTAQRLLLGINHVSFMRIKATDASLLPLSVEQIRLILRDRHDIRAGEPDDFSIRNQLQALDILTSVTNAIRNFLAAIGGTALLVGGIGIMNIMLVSVMERVHEIGLRKAVGARRIHILLQFLIETSLIALMGGVVGIIAGSFVSVLFAFIANYLGYDWDFVLSLRSLTIAVIISLATGLFFGFYPAWRASKMNPIEALRYA